MFLNFKFPSVGYDPSQFCQCNEECQVYNNCCDDYVQVCDNGGGGGGPPTDDGCVVQLDRGNSWPSWPPIIVDSQARSAFKSVSWEVCETN